MILFKHVSGASGIEVVIEGVKGRMVSDGAGYRLFYESKSYPAVFDSKGGFNGRVDGAIRCTAKISSDGTAILTVQNVVSTPSPTDV